MVKELSRSWDLTPGGMVSTVIVLPTALYSRQATQAGKASVWGEAHG